MTGQPLRFVLTGAAGYVVNVAAFACLWRLAVPYAAAAAVAYLVANAFMYLGNRWFTFGLGEDGLLRDYGRYLAVGIVLAALTAMLNAALVESLAADPRLAQAFAVVAITPLGFVLIKRWTFRLAPT